MNSLCILMATYNGEHHLKEQLETIKSQSYGNWDLLVSDDGSTDATLDLLDQFKDDCEVQHSVKIIQGPKQGFVANFLSLVANSSGDAKYFAFSDQDDLWYDDKLQRAVDLIEKELENIPVLYCSRTEVIFENSEIKSFLSPLMQQSPSFNNALVQSIAGGNTMVFNRAARDSLLKFGIDAQVASHDWWIYQVITGVGGKVIYDGRPSLKYRQHGGNLVGANRGVSALFDRAVMFINGRFKIYNDKNIQALLANRRYLTQECQKSLDSFSVMKYGNVWQRLDAFFRSKIRRQGRVFNIALCFGILFKKV